MNRGALTRTDPIREGFFLSDRWVAVSPPPLPPPNNKLSAEPDRHANPAMRAHKHAERADSSAALIADLNRPGDLSHSLTHTRDTSFFFFPFFPSLSPILFRKRSLPLPSCPNIHCVLSMSLCITLLPPPPLSLEPPTTTTTTPTISRPTTAPNGYFIFPSASLTVLSSTLASLCV